MDLMRPSSLAEGAISVFICWYMISFIEADAGRSERCSWTWILSNIRLKSLFIIGFLKTKSIRVSRLRLLRPLTFLVALLDFGTCSILRKF